MSAEPEIPDAAALALLPDAIVCRKGGPFCESQAHRTTEARATTGLRRLELWLRRDQLSSRSTGERPRAPVGTAPRPGKRDPWRHRAGRKIAEPDRRKPERDRRLHADPAQEHRADRRGAARRPYGRDRGVRGPPARSAAARS